MFIWVPPFRAHPRSRGENSHEPLPAPSSEGSSPLTRGKPKLELLKRYLGGLIPAHAGKTNLRYASRAMYRAHPRSRGENGGATGLGTSPFWLIPAHAGKTLPDLRFYRADRSDLGKP